MKVRLISEQVFSVTASADPKDPRKLQGLRVVDQWEGFIKLGDGNGEHLIVRKLRGTGAFAEAFERIFADVFGGVAGTEEWVVICGTSKLLRALEESPAG